MRLLNMCTAFIDYLAADAGPQFIKVKVNIYKLYLYHRKPIIIMYFTV